MSGQKKDHHKLCIIGPTASGKSQLAITLAQQFDGEIISADSRQIHRELSIGTGKEQGSLSSFYDAKNRLRTMYIVNGIPHHMIDIIHPNTVYNVAKFVRSASRIQYDIMQRQKLPIICGGTMFWAQSLLENTTGAPVKPNVSLRSSLQQLTTAQLYTQLEEIDPMYAKKVDPHNPVRLIRAIEIAMTIGHVPEQKPTPIDPCYTLILAISLPRDILHARIEKRMDTWFDNGIFDEILTAHHKLHVPWKRLESFGLEYKWCTRYVRGLISFDVMRENTVRDLKKYAKRQETWIRRWEKQTSHIVRITQEKQAIKLTKDFLNKP